jgi:hypothetical protein
MKCQVNGILAILKWTTSHFRTSDADDNDDEQTEEERPLLRQSLSPVLKASITTSFFLFDVFFSLLLRRNPNPFFIVVATAVLVGVASKKIRAIPRSTLRGEARCKVI